MDRCINYLIFIYFVVLCSGVNAQNLVQNYSFEEYEECPDEVTMISKKNLIPHWVMPTRGTTDYYNACTIRQVNVPDNVMGSMLALDGEAYTGIILLERPPADSQLKRPLHYREYLQTKLKVPLKKDSLYCIQFYFSIASYSTYAVNKIGLYVSTDQVSRRLSTKVIDVEPQIRLDTNYIFTERDYWKQVCDTFKARGGEQYITIGNFYDDFNTKFETLDYSKYRGTIQQKVKENKLAYYYIDVVSVEAISDTSTIFCKNKFSTEKMP